MADTKLVDLTALTAPATGDLFYIVDVSDTTDDASGSSKKITLANVLKDLPSVADTSGPSLGGPTASDPSLVRSTTDSQASLATFRTNLGSIADWGYFKGKGVQFGPSDTILLSPAVGDSGVLVMNGTILAYKPLLTAYLALFSASGTTELGRITPTAATVLTFTENATGGCQLELGQVADVGTPATNCVRIGAEDVAGTAEVIVSDEAGTETQISPHAADGPPELYDEVPGVEIVVRSINRFTNEVTFLNMSRAALCAETGERKKCRFIETLDEYNARTGRNKTKLDWQTVQAEKQAAYDAERVEEQKRHDEWLALVAREQKQYDAGRVQEQRKHDAWTGIEPKLKARVIEPVVRPEANLLAEADAAGHRPKIRQAKDIRKPVPAQLAAKGVQ